MTRQETLSCVRPAPVSSLPDPRPQHIHTLMNLRRQFACSGSIVKTMVIRSCDLPSSRELDFICAKMPFTSPSYIPPLPFSPPDDVPVHEFLFGQESRTKFGRRHAVEESKPPFICGVTGASHSAVDVVRRIEHLARGLASELQWEVNEGDVLDKAVAIYSLNSVGCNQDHQ